MPGLAGYVLDDPATQAQWKAHLTGRLPHPADSIDTYDAGAVWMAHADLPVAADQGGVRVDGDLVLVAYGYVAGTDDTATFLLGAYQRDGAAALAQQNGVYAVAVWNVARRRLVLAQDPGGFAGIYYRSLRAGSVFGTRPRLCNGHDPVGLDGQALGDVLVVGYPLGERTLFEGVRALGPLTTASWDAARRWRLERVPDTLDTSVPAEPEAAIEALDVALADATTAALADFEGRTALPLSGGLDSRALLGYARRHGPLSTFSYGHGHSWDQRFGKRLARVAGTRHRSVALGPDYMARLGPRLVYTTEGQASVHAAHVGCLSVELARRPTVALSGFLGDHLTGAHLNWVQAEANSVAEEARALFDRHYRFGFDEAGLEAILQPQWATAARQVTFDTFLSCYQDAPTPVERADRVDRVLRQRRFVAYQLAVLGQVAVTRVPFADRRVCAALRSWPPEWRRGQRLYLELLRQRHPDLAEVPWSATGVPLAGSGVGWAQLREGVKRRLPGWTGGWIRPHDYRQYAHYDAWLRGASAPLLEGLLADHERLAPVFQMDVLRRLVEEHRSGRRQLYRPLCAVATVQLWLRFFQDARVGVAQDWGNG